MPLPFRSLERFVNEVLKHFRLNVDGSHTESDIFNAYSRRLIIQQCGYVALIFWVGFCGFLRQGKLCADVSGEVFLCGFPAGIPAAGVLRRIAVDMLAKLRNYRVLVLSAELRNIFQVYRLLQIYREVERFEGGVNVRWNAVNVYRPLSEDIRFGKPLFPVREFLDIFNRGQPRRADIVCKCADICAPVEVSVFLYKAVVCVIQAALEHFQLIVGTPFLLRGGHFIQPVEYAAHGFNARL